MERSSGLAAFERGALEIFSASLSQSDFAFDAGGVIAGHRDSTPAGFILTLGQDHPPHATILVERITRFTLMVQHPTFPHDGIVTLLINQLGLPAELEAVRFDHTDWPHDADMATFVVSQPWTSLASESPARELSTRTICAAPRHASKRRGAVARASHRA